MALAETTPEGLKEYEQRFVDEAWNSGNYDIINCIGFAQTS